MLPQERCQLALLLLALPLLWATTGPAEPPPAGAVVERLSFEGVHALPESALRAHLQTEKPPWQPWADRPPFDELALEEDVRRLQALYRQHGYYEANVRWAAAWNEEGTGVHVQLRVVEGEPVRVAEWSIDFQPLPEGVAPDPQALLADLPIGSEQVFRVEDYRRARELLLTRLADVGFPQAELLGGAEVDLASHSVHVAWRVVPGPRVRFGPVEVHGLEQVEAPVVLRELAFQEGDVYSRRALEETRRQLFELELFRTVRVEPREPTPDVAAGIAPVRLPARAYWPVEVAVQERPPRSVRIGGGLGSEEGLRVQVGWEHRNFFGAARKLEVEARYSSLLAGVRTRLAQRHFLKPTNSLILGAALERETLPAYAATRARTTVHVERPIEGPWRGRVGYGFELVDVHQASDDLEFELDNPEQAYRLAYVEGGVLRTTVEGAPDPRRGTSLEGGVQVSPRALGSEFDFAKLSAEARAYVPVGPAVLAARARLGTIEPLRSTSAGDLPLVVRFFSGGSQSVRGFAYQELGPLDEDDDPLGGASLSEASVELRVPLWRALGGVVFVDAGQVSLDPFDWNLGDVFYASGFGLRYRTPIGPLRADVGYVLNPEEDMDRVRLHLSIGQAF